MRQIRFNFQVLFLCLMSNRQYFALQSVGIFFFFLSNLTSAKHWNYAWIFLDYFEKQSFFSHLVMQVALQLHTSPFKFNRRTTKRTLNRLRCFQSDYITIPNHSAHLCMQTSTGNTAQLCLSTHNNTLDSCRSANDKTPSETTGIKRTNKVWGFTGVRKESPKQ